MLRFYLKQTPEKPKHTHLLYEPGYVTPYADNIMEEISCVWMFPFSTRCMNTGSMFKTESGNIVMVMQWSASLTEDDVTSAPCGME